MKRIELTKGMFALVDEEDFERVNNHRWYSWYCKNTNSYYAVNVVTRQHMQRFILDVDSDIIVDHKNHDTLNNMKNNLRSCTSQQNNFNRRISKTANTSGYKGVSWNKQRGNWKAVIKINRKQIYIGSFSNKLEAARAYNEKAIELFGEFAYLNNLKESG